MLKPAWQLQDGKEMCRSDRLVEKQAAVQDMYRWGEEWPVNVAPRNAARVLEASEAAGRQASARQEQLQKELELEARCHKELESKFMQLSASKAEVEVTSGQHKASLAAHKKSLESCQKELSQRQADVQQEAARADASVASSTRIQACFPQNLLMLLHTCRQVKHLKNRHHMHDHILCRSLGPRS